MQITNELIQKARTLTTTCHRINCSKCDATAFVHELWLEDEIVDFTELEDWDLDNTVLCPYCLEQEARSSG